MKCPNCGKEAINVNGKFVCLDCGIEITPTQAVPSAPVEPPIVNHQTPTPADPATVSNPDSTLLSNETVIQPPTDLKEPVKDSYLDELKKAENSTGGSYDFDQAPPTPAPVVPKFEPEITTDVPATNPASVTPESVTPDSTPPIAPLEPVAKPNLVPMEPVVTESVPAETTTETPQELPVSEPENTLTPAVEVTPNESLGNEPKQNPIEVPQEIPVAVAPETPPVEMPPTVQPSDFPSEPLVDNPIPGSPASDLIPESYFQPSAIDITAANPQTEIPEQGPVADLNTVTPTEAPAPTVAPVTEIDNQTTSSSLDALLDNYSTPTNQPQTIFNPQMAAAPNPNYQAGPTAVDTMQPAAPQLQTPTSNQMPVSNPGMPGVSNMPSPESVFGTSPQNNQPQAAPKKGLNKKILLIIGAAVGVIVLIIGLLVGFTILGGQKKTNNELSQELMFQISDAVAGIMDDTLDAEVKFEQTLDFTKATVKATDADGLPAANLATLKTMFEKPLVQKGFWRVNQAGDIYVDQTVGGEVNKKIYKADEKSTYVFSQANNNWSKAEGYSINQIPSFYSVQNRGSLFYLTKINGIEEKGKEEIDGTVYTKLRIIPKVDMLQAFLTETSKALENTKYEEVSFDNIEILAWTDDENKIVKVTVNGDIGVKSDLYVGTVSVKSEANYKYEPVEIQKPQI